MVANACAPLGTLSTAGGATIGWLIDRSFDGTIIPISIGFLACGVVAMGLVYWAGRGSNLKFDRGCATRALVAVIWPAQGEDLAKQVRPLGG